MKYLGQSILFFLTAVLIGALAYGAYAGHYGYQQTNRELFDLQQSVLTGPLWRYGTVAAVDPGNSSITINFPNSNFPTGSALVAQVSPDAFIGLQNLTGENGVYDSETAPVPATLTEVPVGSNVAVVLRQTNGVFYVSMLLFGNPL